MFGLTVGVQYCSGIGKFLGKRVVDGFKVATTCVYVLKYAHCFCSLILTPFCIHSLAQHGMTALELAEQEEHEDCVALLKQVRV